jgi:DNA-directed RNA polymerase subunit M/transcription elongation factor TFIIS
MDPKFQKTVEDFTCEHCGVQVIGNGYTNHCPRCLWSKHVDIHPGDRAALCGGMMEPVSVEGSTGEGYRIRHRCKTCGHEKINDTQTADSSDALVALAQRHF